MITSHAEQAVKLLRSAQDALTAYRKYVEGTGEWRAAMSDLALLDELDVLAEAVESVSLTSAPDEAMVKILAAHEQVTIDDSGYIWQGFSEDAVDLLERIGLLVHEDGD